MEDLNKLTFRPEEQSQELPSYSSEEDTNEEENITEKNLQKKNKISLRQLIKFFIDIK